MSEYGDTQFTRAEVSVDGSVVVVHAAEGRILHKYHMWTVGSRPVVVHFKMPVDGDEWTSVDDGNLEPQLG